MSEHTSRRAGQSDFRALTPFECLGQEHQTFAITDDASEPHLRKGEYAVIDTADREVQNGELYLIQNKTNERERRIIQVKSDRLNITGPGAAPSLVWWIRDLAGFRKVDILPNGITLFNGLSDGPYETKALQSRLIGRVVGFALSPLGGLIARAAGYDNEEA